MGNAQNKLNEASSYPLGSNRSLAKIKQAKGDQVIGTNSYGANPLQPPSTVSSTRNPNHSSKTGNTRALERSDSKASMKNNTPNASVADQNKKAANSKRRKQDSPLLPRTSSKAFKDKAAQPTNSAVVSTTPRSQQQQSMSTNQYKVMPQQSMPAPMDPRAILTALIGEKPTLRSCLRLAVSIAKEHREALGKFRKDERHACMELYETLGLEEDDVFGPTSEIQAQLRQYVFPPPNMHLLKDVTEIDDETMDYILGPKEGALRRSLLDPDTIKDQARKSSSSNAVRRAGISSESTFKDGMSAAMHGASAAYKCIPKNKDQAVMLTKAMENCVLFKDLDDRDQKILFDAFELELFAADEVIFEKGDEGERFYMISQGACRIDLPAGPMYIKKGATFGELGILYGTPRAATVTATELSAIWFIDRDTYRSVLMHQTLRKRDLYMRFLNSVHILDTMEDYEKARISDTLQTKVVEKGALLCREGERGDAMYFIEEGTIQVTKESGLRAELHAGDYFGELAILLQCPRKATCIALTPCRLLKLDRQDFTNALGPLESILRRSVHQYEKYITEATQLR